jgi:hypothetical protein
VLPCWSGISVYSDPAEYYRDSTFSLEPFGNSPLKFHGKGCKQHSHSAAFSINLKFKFTRASASESESRPAT